MLHVMFVLHAHINGVCPCLHAARPYCVHSPCPCCTYCLYILHGHVSRTCCTYVRTCCKYKLHVYFACLLLLVHVSMLQSVSPSCMSMMHVHAAYLCCLSMLHFRCTSCCMSMLYVYTACPCFMFLLPVHVSMLLVHVACLCFVSMLHVYAACRYSCLCPIHSACLCCMSIPHVYAACPCFMPTSPCCIAHPFELPPLPHFQNPSNHPRT
jgi:hypothetical protein